MRRLIILGASLLVACGPPTGPTPQCGFVGSTSSTPPVTRVGFVLLQARLTLEAPRTVVCTPTNPVATSVQVEVFDPDNLPVRNTYSEPSSTLQGFAMVVSFTPEKAGLYHVSVRFDPSLGAAQSDYIAVEDRTDDLGTFLGFVPTVCEEAHPVGDTVLCLKSGTVQAWRDGGMELVASAARGLDSSDDVAWVREVATVSRFDVDDGGLRRLSVGFAQPLAPRGGVSQRYVELGRSVIEEVRVVDGGLSRSSFTLETIGQGSSLALSGDSLGWLSDGQLCSASFDGGSRCVKATSMSPLKADGDSLWLVDSEGLTNQWRVFADGRPSELRGVSMPTVGFIPVPSTHPLFLWDGNYVTSRPNDLAWEVWPQRSLVSTVTVTSTHVVFRQTNGAVTSYRR